MNKEIKCRYEMWMAETLFAYGGKCRPLAIEMLLRAEANLPLVEDAQAFLELDRRAHNIVRKYLLPDPGGV